MDAKLSDFLFFLGMIFVFVRLLGLGGTEGGREVDFS